METMHGLDITMTKQKRDQNDGRNKIDQCWKNVRVQSFVPSAHKAKAKPKSPSNENSTENWTKKSTSLIGGFLRLPCAIWNWAIKSRFVLDDVDYLIIISRNEGWHLTMILLMIMSVWDLFVVTLYEFRLWLSNIFTRILRENMFALKSNQKINDKIYNV